MKRVGYEIVDSFKHLNIPDTHRREVKALAVAQALAYAVPLTGDTSVEEQCESFEVNFRTLLNEINERTPLDVALCRTYFRSLVKVRYELLTSVTSPELLKFLVTSDLQRDQLTTDEAQLFKAFAGDRGFRVFQRDIAGVMDVVFERTVEEDAVRDPVGDDRPVVEGLNEVESPTTMSDDDEERS